MKSPIFTQKKEKRDIAIFATKFFNIYLNKTEKSISLIKHSEITERRFVEIMMLKFTEIKTRI